MHPWLPAIYNSPRSGVQIGWVYHACDGGIRKSCISTGKSVGLFVWIENCVCSAFGIVCCWHQNKIPAWNCQSPYRVITKRGSPFFVSFRILDNFISNERSSIRNGGNLIFRMKWKTLAAKSLKVCVFSRSVCSSRIFSHFFMIIE